MGKGQTDPPLQAQLDQARERASLARAAALANAFVGTGFFGATFKRRRWWQRWGRA